MSEKLFLQWNDFQENIKRAFGHLREENDFADVTLACEDGQQVEAHKVILAASSPFFQKLLGRFKHPHPLHQFFEDIELRFEVRSRSCPSHPLQVDLFKF